MPPIFDFRKISNSLATFKHILLSRSEISDARWDAWMQSSPEASPFCLSGYLDRIHSEWQALIIEDGSDWQAVMPLPLLRRLGADWIRQPLFSQQLGVCFARRDYPGPEAEYRNKRRILQMIVEKLPDSALFDLNFSPAFDYPMPFYWAGYSLKTRFTYRLDLRQSMEELTGGFAPELRRRLKKAARSELKLVEGLAAGDLLDLYRKNEARGRKMLPNTKAWQSMEGLLSWIQNQSGGLILGIGDPEGELLAAGAFFPFGDGMYLLFNVQHPERKDSGAMAALILEGIKIGAERGMEFFDFEGSMIEGIETFNRRFGARPVSYFQISRNRLPLPARWILALKFWATSLRT